jgi:repressor of nif and glnA expression
MATTKKTTNKSSAQKAQKTTAKPKTKAKNTKKSTTKNDNVNYEKFKVKGQEAVDQIKKIINEGNARRIIVKDKKENTILEIPVTVGVVGTLFAPILAGVGAIVALVSECSIIVERKNTVKKK